MTIYYFVISISFCHYILSTPSNAKGNVKPVYNLERKNISNLSIVCRKDLNLEYLLICDLNLVDSVTMKSQDAVTIDD